MDNHPNLLDQTLVDTLKQSRIKRRLLFRLPFFHIAGRRACVDGYDLPLFVDRRASEVGVFLLLRSRARESRFSAPSADLIN